MHGHAKRNSNYAKSKTHTLACGQKENEDKKGRRIHM